jgi:hypothetical protein
MGLRDWTAKWAEAKAAKALDARLAAIAADTGRSLRDEIEEWTAAGRDRPALVGAAGTLAYRDLYGEANRWGRWAILHGLAVGEPVVLLATARPERFAAFLGLASVGVAPAFLDPTLAPEAVAAAIGALHPAHVVVDGDLLDLFEAAAPHLAHPCAVWIHGPHAMAYRRIDEALAELSPVRLIGRDRRPIAHGATAVLVVHADADHRPHVERLDHGRLMAVTMELAALLGATRDDRLAVIETALSLESLIAPVIALAVGAPCRLVAATREAAPLDAAAAFRPTVLFEEAPTAPLPAPSLRLALATHAAPPPATVPDGAVLHRRFALRRDGDDVHLTIDDRDIRLPPPEVAISS